MWIGWEFNFRCFLSLKFFLLVNDYQKLFKTIFWKFLPRLFLNSFAFTSFYDLFSCQIHSFMNQSTSSFLPWTFFDALVMWLGHQTSTQMIRVQIPAKPNFFSLVWMHSLSGEFEPQSSWSKVWCDIRLATESERVQARKIVTICFILFRYLVTSACQRE